MPEAKWLEVSLTVDGELAEAVADVLARFAPQGVAIETPVEWQGAGEVAIPSGAPRVCAYLPVDAHLEERRNKLEEALWYLGRIRPLPQASYRYVQETDWAEAWKQHYQPMVIGKRLAIVPAWLENPFPDRLAVRMDPGMAFGTGTHPSTRLCLELLEARAGQIEGLIDVGCGSGILSIAALKLGARHALAVDMDELAVRATRQNAELNGVSGRLRAELASVAEVRAGAYGTKQAEMVVANILAPVILQLFADGLADLVALGGRLILAGIIAEQAAEVEAAAGARGLRLIQRRSEGDWVALEVGSD
ncbi:MAG: 50S ribosomal protein L11 methyltransferase [Anaerolineales bacterium]|nr:50S ribosomal protein L11 methyltransferase [Anaerolineales bacterium]